jgi:hypothetical protein
MQDRNRPDRLVTNWVSCTDCSVTGKKFAECMSCHKMVLKSVTVQLLHRSLVACAAG